jgi:hypothetical protein
MNHETDFPISSNRSGQKIHTLKKPRPIRKMDIDFKDNNFYMKLKIFVVTLQSQLFCIEQTIVIAQNTI